MKNIAMKLLDNDKLIIRTLDYNTLVEYFDEILRIDTASLGHYKLWSREIFFKDYPNKWILSKIALLNNKPIGYCIVSSYCHKKVQIHRISIDIQYRRIGVGENLIYKVLHEASYMKLIKITLESLRDNFIANQFYRKLGFRELDEIEIKNYLIDKNKILKSNEFYVVNKTGDRLVFSIEIPDFHGDNKYEY